MNKETKREKLLNILWRLENASHGCDTSKCKTKEQFLKEHNE